MTFIPTKEKTAPLAINLSLLVVVLAGTLHLTHNDTAAGSAPREEQRHATVADQSLTNPSNAVTTASTIRPSAATLTDVPG